MKRFITILLSFFIMLSIAIQVPNIVYAKNTLKTEQVLTYASVNRKVTPKLAKTKLKIKQGTTYTLKYKKAKGSVKWKSADKSIATIDDKGKIKAKKAGVTKVTLYGKNMKSVSCTVHVTITQKQAKKSILALKKKYPEGKYWTDENNYYYWKAIDCHCYGCIALAGEVSDTVFGKKSPVNTHENFDKIKIGDHVRIINEGHSVIVLSKSKDYITVLEGNYDSSIHWGRKLTKKYLKSQGFYVDTRY